MQTHADESQVALQQALAVAVASFPIVQLVSGSQRLKTAIAAAIGTNKQIIGEFGYLLAVTFAVASPAQTYLTNRGVNRLELERAQAPNQ